MSTSGQPDNSMVGIPLQDPKGDEARAEAHETHDLAREIEHAHEHFRENNLWFLGCFLPVILISVAVYSINFGSWNPFWTWTATAIRSFCIALFLQHLFKDFSFVFRTLFFTLFFLGGMIFLSLWDSELRGIGNPIKDVQHPETQKV